MLFRSAEEPAEVAKVNSDIDEEMAKINETISQQLFAEDVKLEANVAPAVVETVNEEASAESDTERTEGNETVMSEDDISELQESTTEEINDEVSSAAEKDAPEEMVTSDVVEENTKEETTESGVETETADDAKDAESEETVEAPAVENEAKIEEKPVKEVQQLSSDTSPYVIKKYMDEIGRAHV